ncbi:MAG: diaminopimelate decarboxylase [Halomonadaceae bacterium]|nr:MAG: diaminopimelate decarboxylase [Halomonadaceae bacterium]
MDHFSYRNQHLWAEEVPVADIARDYGTPCYVYSRATLERHYRAYDEALQGLPHLVCYAVKANSNLAVLSCLARLGAGFDIVSVGELERVLRAGGDPAKVVFSGVGKQRHEMVRALEVGVRCFNMESEAEMALLNEVAVSLGKVAPVSLRVNPDVDAGTHPYISTGLKENKFGIEIESAGRVYREAAELPNLAVVGVDCHIGSQLTTQAPFLDALDRVLALVDELAAAGVTLKHIDMGGGLGVPYQDEQPPSPQDYAASLRQRLAGRDLELVLEPGRSIAANAGILVTRVELLKCTPHRNFAVVDAAMNDLIRPALYSAWQEIVPVDQSSQEPQRHYDIVGPVCETGDFLGKDRPLSLAAGDLLAVRSAGAYGFVMSSNYNSRNRPPEIMVDGDRVHLARRRETIADQLGPEAPLPT